MKDVIFLNSSVDNFNGRLPVFKFDHMYQNQGRTFGPLLGLFLVNLFARAVTAKYDSYFPLTSFDPNPWLAYNRPLASYKYEPYNPQWYPIKSYSNYQNYHTQSYQNYPTLTTVAPYVTNQYLASAVDYDSNYPERSDYYSVTHSPNNFDGLMPAESNIIAKRQKKDDNQHEEQTTQIVEETAIVNNTIEEPVLAESSVRSRRQPVRNRQKRPTRPYKYSQKRRRTTIPPSDYYEDISYEDYTERYPPNRRRTTPPTYYDDEEQEDYYDSFETTTKYKKQKRRPTRNPNKNPNRKRFPPLPPPESFEDPDVERFGPQTEIVIVRQAATTTTIQPTTTTTAAATTTTTTAASTVTTNLSTTTQASTNTTGLSNSTATFGYGPSNGNEDVSFTYGPPVGGNKYQYSVPYFDWYTHDTARNAIVKRVRDIVGFDKKYRYK